MGKTMRKEFKPDAEIGWVWGQRFEELCHAVRERRERAAAAKAAAKSGMSVAQEQEQASKQWCHSGMRFRPARDDACCEYCTWSGGRCRTLVSPYTVRKCQLPTRAEIKEANLKRKALLEEKKRDEAKKLDAWKTGRSSRWPAPRTGILHCYTRSHP